MPDAKCQKKYFCHASPLFGSTCTFWWALSWFRNLLTLNDRDIFVRMLYKDSYWFLLTFTFYFIFCYAIHRPKFHLFYHFTLDCIRWTCQLIIKRIPVRIVCGQYIYFGQFLVCPTVPPPCPAICKSGGTGFPLVSHALCFWRHCMHRGTSKTFRNYIRRIFQMIQTHLESKFKRPNSGIRSDKSDKKCAINWKPYNKTLLQKLP